MKVISGWSTVLSASMTTSQTTVPLVSIQTIDNTPTTIVAGLVDSVGYMVIEPNSARTEIIKFTGITDNGDGSGILTGVTRGLQFSGTLETAMSGNNKAHQAGSRVIMTDVHWYLDDLVDLSSAETISGVKTFSVFPQISAGTPSDPTDVTTKQYVDTTATGTTIIAAISVPATAGEVIAAGDVVYFDDITNNEWMLCTADGSTPSTTVIVGIAQGAGTDGNAISGGVIIIGQDKNQSGRTPGAIQYISDTAGDLSETPGTNSVKVGIARSASTVYIDPNYDATVTSGQKDALSGSSGSPGSGNKYVTQDDVSAVGGSGKIIRASLTTIAPGIFVPVEQLEHTQSSQGDIIYRAADKWTRLVAGTTGQFLKTQGASANPMYAYSLIFKNGTTTHAGDAASGDQTIAHGLGIVPKYVRITVEWARAINDGDALNSTGVYNGTTTSCVYRGGTTGGADVETGVDTTNIIHLSDGGGNTDMQVATIAIDATNITLTWTKSGTTPATTIQIMWEAFA